MREDKETLDKYYELTKKAGKKTLSNLVKELMAAFERAATKKKKLNSILLPIQTKSRCSA